MHFNHFLLKCIALFNFLFIFSSHSFCQDERSSDDLFQQARKDAFERKDYNSAIQLCRKALLKSPDYPDIRIFLGRIYIWTDHLDSARYHLSYVLHQNPANEEALGALIDLEYWNGHSDKALEYCQTGLSHNPRSPDLLLKKARILNDLKQYEKALLTLRNLIQADPSNKEAIRLLERIRNNNARNKLGVSYDFVYFNKQFDNPWHLISIDYTRQTKYGSIAFRLDYANRFNSNGSMFEIDAYPKISKRIYFYLNGGYSNDIGIFPQYRFSWSIYANLPKSYEAEAGLRYLYFSSGTFVYTASLGKYFKNFWFNFRTYLVPDKKNISQSYNLVVRYYLGGANDYIMLGAGTGISPDDRRNDIQLNTIYKLKSNKISMGYRHTIRSLNIVTLDATWINQEYLAKTFGNQYDFGIGYQRRF
jgi:YaiO family outer membrane protein